MPVVYIETSIVSYLRQRPASQVVAAARQLLTQRWWNDERSNYELVTSQYVLDEAALGDRRLSAERVNHLEGMPLLSLDPEIQIIADRIVSSGVVPAFAEYDALHIAIAAYHRVDYFIDMELHPHRQCKDPPPHSRDSCRVGTCCSNHLHTRGDVGR